MIKKIFKGMDYLIIGISIVLFAIGIVALYSANGGIEGDTAETAKQIVWFFVGLACMIVIVFIDYEVLRKIMDSNLRPHNWRISWCSLHRTN